MVSREPGWVSAFIDVLANTFIVLGVLVAMGLAVAYALHIYRCSGISSLIVTEEKGDAAGGVGP